MKTIKFERIFFSTKPNLEKNESLTIELKSLIKRQPATIKT